MTSTRFTLPLLALALCATPAITARAQQDGPPPPPPQQNYDANAGANAGAWDAPPADFRDAMMRRAFHDGIQAAHNDIDAHRQLDYHRSPLFKHPPVTGPHHDEYRNAFERGYDVALHHSGIPGY